MAASRQPQATTPFTIDPATVPGHVHYTTADLDLQIAFYQNVLGFRLHWRQGAAAGLGAGGDDLLRLTHVPAAQRTRGTTGLYHTAFLVPSRRELAQLLKRIVETGTRMQGMSNHGTHLALYLPDAEGNGIELAWDFPHEQWPKTFEEMLRRNRGVSPEEILSALDDRSRAWGGLDAGSKVGHVHLHVAHIDATERFYHGLLGLDIPYDAASAPPGVAGTMIFFSAGGYHHHVGANVWQGVGAPPPPADAIGLRYLSLVLPNRDEVARVVARLNGAEVTTESTESGILARDPSGNGVLLAAPPGA